MKTLVLLVVLLSTGWWIFDTYHQGDASESENYAVSIDSNAPEVVPLRVQHLKQEVKTAERQVKQAVTDYLFWGIGIIGLLIGLIFVQMSYQSILNLFKE